MVQVSSFERRVSRVAAWSSLVSGGIVLPAMLAAGKPWNTVGVAIGMLAAAAALALPRLGHEAIADRVFVWFALPGMWLACAVTPDAASIAACAIGLQLLAVFATVLLQGREFVAYAGAAIAAFAALTGWGVVRLGLEPNLVLSGVVGGCFVSAAFVVLGLYATHLRELLAASRASERRALVASHAKSTFLANMSHELRTPLNAVVGYAELLLEEGPTDAFQRVSLERIGSSGRNLLVLIDDLLALARLESGDEPVVLAVCDVGVVVREVVRVHGALLNTRGNTVAFQIPERLLVTSDESRLRAIVHHLVHNAARFTERGAVRIGGEASDRSLRLWVSDTGVGIPADRLEAVFEPFVQADASPTRRFEGTGLGLALVRHYATQLNGRVVAESVVGQGSTFTLTVPIG